jgi:G protein-coupled receptor GPR1
MSDSYDYATAVVDNYTDHQQLVLRALSVTASCLSIVFGLVGLYLYVSMKRKVFRHHLILLLLLFDFGKAVVLLWYPARVLTVSLAYDNTNFCDVVGFFTSVFIEGADLAVLALAIHTALLVFKKYNGPEGGLYKYRYWVYGFNILFPLVMASLVFIDHGRKAYQPYITWCYLPVRPVWYRLWLSWIPRWIIIVAIISIYVSIYVYIKLQYREVVKNFKQSQEYAPKVPHKNIFKRIGHIMINFLANFPGFAFLEMGGSPATRENRENSSSTIDPNDARVSAIAEFQRQSIIKFEIRRNVIERQVRSIFVYPVAYIFLWLAPFGLQCVQFNFEFEHGTVFWLAAAAAFMQPFNCVVDTVAFCIRERPWKVHEEKIFTRENGDWVKRRFTLTRRDTHGRAQHEGEQHDPEKSLDDRNGGHDFGSPNTQGNGMTSESSSSPNRKFSYPSDDYIQSPLGSGPHDPFATTASKMEIDLERGHTGDSESEIDILEFLK